GRGEAPQICHLLQARRANILASLRITDPLLAGLALVGCSLVRGIAAREAGNGSGRADRTGTGLKWLALRHALQEYLQGVPPAVDLGSWSGRINLVRDALQRRTG